MHRLLVLLRSSSLTLLSKVDVFADKIIGPGGQVSSETYPPGLLSPTGVALQNAGLRRLDRTLLDI